MSDSFTLPSMPDQTKVAMFTSTALTVLKLLAGGGIVGSAWAAKMLAGSPDRISQLVTLALFGASIVSAILAWLGSWWEHHQIAVDGRRVAVGSAVASLAHGVPVIVTVTPAGQSNIATAISPAELTAAPSVPPTVRPAALAAPAPVLSSAAEAALAPPVAAPVAPSSDAMHPTR